MSASTSKDGSSDTSVYLSTLSSSVPASLHEPIAQLERLSSRKLWHQLSNALHAFLRVPESGPYQIQLYDNFIAVYAARFDQLRLVEMAVTVAQQYDDGNAALTFLKSVQASVDKPKTVEAHLLASTEAAHFSLLLGDVDSASSALTNASKTLDTLDNVPAIVHASFYRVQGDLHKSKAEYSGYYKNSLLYLACVNDIDTDLSRDERISRAHDLGIAALLGEDIYNFGELLMHPILKSLKETQYDWLYQLLYAFNAGSIGKFESLLPYLQEEPILSSSLDFLRPKICLMSLIDLIFRLPSSSRTAIPFSSIARETKLPVEEVEHLVMKALALSLVKGSIDQVLEIASVDWVQPRVLDMQQIGELANRLDGWQKKVGEVGVKALKGNEVLMVQ